MWIARDRNGCLFVYDKKPQRNTAIGFFYSDTMNIDAISNDFFPEVTWENSPKELVVKEEER